MTITLNLFIIFCNTVNIRQQQPNLRLLIATENLYMVKVHIRLMVPRGNGSAESVAVTAH